MALMLSNSTTPDPYDVSIQHGAPRYQASLDKYNIHFMMPTLFLLTAVPGMGAALSPATVSLYECQIPGVSFLKEEKSAVTIPTSEKIAAVLSFYSLGKSHVSMIVSISRPALYAWIDGSSEPDAANFKKIEELYSIAREIDPSFQNRIYRGFIERPLSGFSQSLFDVFVSYDDLTTSAIRAQIKDAYDQSVERIHNIEQRRNGSFAIPHSNAERELNLEDNL
jgi:hypothetical protein